jgi:hypothetical protein
VTEPTVEIGQYLQALNKGGTGILSFYNGNSANATPFSNPYDPNGYNDTSISDAIITELYKHFIDNCRQRESEAHLRSLTGMIIIVISLRSMHLFTNVQYFHYLGIALSIDHTMRAASKATSGQPLSGPS